MKDNAKDRLLRAAAELLDAAPGEPVSTRAVCERAGVAAPTLYHHFGSKQGLLDAVVEFGLGQYAAQGDADDDPVSDLRRGWDQHVQYGLDHPAFYVLLYGGIAPGRPCKVTAVAQAQLTRLLERAERRGLLRVPVDEAAEQIVAANVGVTLQLIAEPAGAADLELSVALRENVLAGLLVTSAPERGPVSEVAQAAAALADALAGPGGGGPSLSDGERVLLGEWLSRLSRT